MKSKTTGSFIPILCSIIFNSALIGLAIQVHAADKVRVGFSALSFANSPHGSRKKKAFSENMTSSRS
jgi:hypothetical protein